MCKISGHKEQMVELCMCMRNSEYSTTEMDIEKQLKVQEGGSFDLEISCVE